MHNFKTGDRVVARDVNRVGEDVDHPNRVLTVRDDESVGAIEVRILLRNDGIMINPWEDGRNVAIVGEDLYALRELLNELPEEAFVRPADPVDPTLKALQDAPYRAIAIDGDGDVYRRVDDYPQRPWRREKTSTHFTARQLAHFDAKVVWTPES